VRGGEAAARCGGGHPARHLCKYLLPPSRLQSEFIIIACDGVWDVMEDQEAVDLVRVHLRGDGGGSGELSRTEADVRIKTAAQLLVDASLARGSSDNVTALVLYL
jgi:serine/threonine protein phosphatase PrpC